MDNTGYEINGLSIFSNNPIDEAIQENPDTVKIYGDQTINGDKIFNGTVTLENEIIHNSTSFSTVDGIIEQLKNNTGDMLDYGNYAVYNDGVGTKYKGMINKKGTDKFYIFHAQTNQPVTSLNLGTQNLGSIVVREPTEDNEVATKKYVEDHAGGNFLPLGGGSMTGNINMNQNRITDLYFLQFNGQWNHSFITFKDTHKLTLGASNTTNQDIDPFIHLNDTDSDKLIELMKDINLHGNISVRNSKRITGLLTPVDNSEPATKEYVDTHTDDNYLPLSGGTMTGNINMGSNSMRFGTNTIDNIKGNYNFTAIRGDNGHFLSVNQDHVHTNTDFLMEGGGRIKGLLTPITNDEASNKSYTDTKLSLAGGTLTGVLTVNNEIHIEQDRRLRFGSNNDNRIILDDINNLGIYSSNGFLVFRPNDLLTNTTLNMGTNDIINVKELSINEALNIGQNKRINLGPLCYIREDNQSLLTIFRGQQFLAMNNDGIYTNQNIDMKNNNITGIKTLSTKSIFVPEKNDNENALFFAGTHNDRPGNDGNYHTGIVERVYNSAENSELLLYKGNDTTDRIRLVASSIRFQAGAMTQDTLSTEYTNVMVVSGDQVDILKKLHMNGFKIENVAAPTADNDAATKKYVDDKTVKYSNTLSLSVNNNSSYAYGIFNFENIPAGSNGNRPFVIDMFSSFSYSASGDDLFSISADIIYKNASGTQVGTTFSTGAAYNASKTIVNTRFITLINKEVFQFPPGAVECEVEILINSTAAISKSGRIIVTINDTNGL